MTDSQTLLLVLAIIYLTDCVLWAPALAVLVWTPYRAWRWSRSGRFLASPRGGPFLRYPLPPLGSTFLTSPWPLSISPDGVYSYVSQAPDADERPPQDERFILLDACQRVEANARTVSIGGEAFVRTSSEGLAEHLANLIRRVCCVPREQRAAIIETALADALDERTVKERVAEYGRESRTLRIVCNALFAIVFVAGPVAVWRFGWTECWLFLLLAMLGTLASVVIEYFGAHRALYTDDRSERRLHAVVMLLNPLAAIRANDALARDLVAISHPLAVVKALGTDTTLRGFARRVLIDVRHPLLPVCPSDDPSVTHTESWFRERLTVAVEAAISRWGLDANALLEPDPPEDDTCHSSCPRCGRQFTLVSGECGPCGGIALRALKQ